MLPEPLGIPWTDGPTDLKAARRLAEIAQRVAFATAARASHRLGGGAALLINGAGRQDSGLGSDDLHLLLLESGVRVGVPHQLTGVSNPAHCSGSRIRSRLCFRLSGGTGFA